MNRLKPYFAITFALILAVSPLLQTPRLEAATVEGYCGCCQGPCAGCCCTLPDAVPEEEPGDPREQCPCDLSTLPVLPDTPMLSDRPRADERIDIVALASDHPSSALPLSERPSPPGPSPPQAKSPPAYILFGALLI
jgi:hypothetical protein